MNREFTISAGWKIFSVILALLLVGLSVLVITKASPNNAAVYFVPVLFIIVAVAVVLPSFKRTLIITDTTITNVDVFKTTTIEIADVKGMRFGPKGKSVYLESKSGAPKLTIANYDNFGDSADLIAWLKANFKDEDAIAYQQELDHILADTNLGFTVEDRQAQLNKARNVAYGYNIGGGILVAAAIIGQGGQPVVDILTLVYPILSIGIIVTGKGLIKFFDKKKSPYYNISIGMIAPVFGQLVSLSNYHVLQYDNFWLPFIGVALVLTAVFYQTDRTHNTNPIGSHVFLLLIICTFYSFESVGQINRDYDHSTEQVYPATVVGHYVTHGKSTSYHLQLSAWGPQTEEDQITVSSGMYADAPVGSTLNIHLKKGMLNIPWYTVSQ